MEESVVVVDEANLPMVSVIIPTRNRRVTLQATLKSLQQQSYPQDRYEVMVVDNGSDDGTKEMVEEMAARSGGLIRYLRQDNQGPALARNRGIQETTGEIVAFTDSDCVADADWLRAGARALEQDERLGLIVGRVMPMPNQQITFLSRVGWREKEDFIYGTANMFYRRKALEEVDGFSPFFRIVKLYKDYVLGGEDTELAWRVKNAGWKSAYAHDSLIYHEVQRLTPLQYLIVLPGQCQILPYLTRKIPLLRQQMLLRYFLTIDTALFDLLLLGILLAVAVHPASLLLALPFSYRIATKGVKGQKKKIVKFAFYHLYFGACFLFLAYGSIKYRSLLL